MIKLFDDYEYGKNRLEKFKNSKFIIGDYVSYNDKIYVVDDITYNSTLSGVIYKYWLLDLNHESQVQWISEQYLKPPEKYELDALKYNI